MVKKCQQCGKIIHTAEGKETGICLDCIERNLKHIEVLKKIEYSDMAECDMEIERLKKEDLEDE